MSNDNSNQRLKICERRYTVRSVSNQKVQKFMPVLDGNLSAENAPKLSVKYLECTACKTKQIQNIPGTLRTFLNQPKNFLVNFNPKTL